jgi:hypothetical protein
MYYKIYTKNPSFTGKRRNYFFVKGVLIVDKKEVADLFEKDGMSIEVVKETSDELVVKKIKAKGGLK